MAMAWLKLYTSNALILTGSFSVTDMVFLGESWGRALGKSLD